MKLPKLWNILNNYIIHINRLNPKRVPYYYRIFFKKMLILYVLEAP